MSTLLKAGDSEPEQPLREGWLVKQSGGASTRARRRSVGEIMKKWDERYFVLTTQRLYYFKTMEDFKRGSDPSGIISIKDHVVEGAASPLEFGLRGDERTYKFKADDEGMAGRWITALRAVQISSIAEWTNRELITFGRICGFPEECLSWLQAQNYDGQMFGRLKSPSHLASKGYSGRSDTVWTLLNGLRTPAVHDWLNRFSAFCQKNAAERQLENAEMLCLIRLGKGLELMNLLDKPDDADTAPAPAPAPAYTAPAPAPQVYAPAPAPAPAYDYGGYDEDDDGPVADDV